MTGALSWFFAMARRRIAPGAAATQKRLSLLPNEP
jgi:hypothetical protein